MNLKKSILSFMAAGAILAGGFGGVMAADYTSHTTGVVSVTTDNTFNPYFCSGNVDFGAVHINSASTDQSRKANGRVIMCYSDTTAQRGTFVATMRSSAFTTVYTSDTIAASNLKPMKVYNPQQGQNSSALCGPVSAGGIRPCVGDIGGYDGQNGKVTTGGADYDGTAWKGGSLDGSGQKIAYGWNGKGTANISPWETDSRLYWGSYHVVDLVLEIPQNTPANQYFSTLTLDVNLNAAP